MLARLTLLALTTLAALVTLAGCAEQTIRQDARAALRAGDDALAIQQLQDGVARYPDSVDLRSGLLQARDEALRKRLGLAAALKADGNWDQAEAELQRAKSLHVGDARVDALLLEIATLRRQQAALAEAERLVEKKQPEAAQRLLEQALKDNPRNAALLALQRRLELQRRSQQAQASAAAASALAETRAISLDFRDAGLRTVLDVVSRNSGINFILDRDIRPDTRVTVFMRQAKVEDALDLIIGTNQLAKKVVDAQTIIIYPNTPDKQREYQEQIVRVFYLASAEAKGAAAFLRAMLKIREPFVDERSNMLALRESVENIQLAERLIALYDAGEPEVLLEVEVLEVSATRLTDLGVKFPDSFSLTPLAPTGATGLTLGNISTIGRDRVGLGISGLLVNLKREVGDFSTLANPKIRARNKEKAKILIGDKVPVITTTTGTGGFVSDSVNYIDVGLKLDVEPTVYADDEVAIKIAMEVSTLGAAVRTNSGTLAYQIGTRTASTLLRLKDGETQLLAGLISRDERSSSSRVPGVGDLPGLGRLFSSQQDNGQRTELILAITPRILRNIRRPDANETEMWVGTDALPRLRWPTTGLRSAVAEGAEPVLQASLSAGSPAGTPTDVPRVVEPTPVATLAWRGPAQARLGDTVELQLLLNAMPGLRGLPVDLAFDPKRLQLVDAAEGDYFRRDGALTAFSQSLDAAVGRLRIGVLRNQATLASGEATLLSLKFKTLAAGQASISVSGAVPVTLGGVNVAPPQTAPWVITVR